MDEPTEGWALLWGTLLARGLVLALAPLLAGLAWIAAAVMLLVAGKRLRTSGPQDRASATPAASSTNG